MASMALAFDILARDRASKTFDRVGDSAARAGKRGQVFGTLLKGAAGVAGGAAVAIAGLGVAAAGMGIKTAAANEQAKISFTTMLGSGQKAAKFLKDLQAFAAATPFEFPELQTAASSLISAGVNASKVIPIMRTLGDVTSGMGTGAEGVQRATIAIQQMNAAGRITGEDLNQLRDAGIPVYDLLSKATGKSKAEVVKLAQAGKLGQKELGQMMKALESGKGLERFSGLMDKQSKSLSGLWSTFKDTLNMGLAKAIEPLIPLLKDGLGKASEFLAAVLPKVASGLAWFVRTAMDLGKAIGKSDALPKFARGMNAVGGFITGKVIPAVASFVGWIKNDLWPAIMKGYQTIMPAIQQALKILGSAFKGTGKSGEGFSNAIKGIGHIIVDYVIPIWAKVISVWLPMLAREWKIIITVIRYVGQAFLVMRDVVGRVVSFILHGIGNVATMFAGLLRALSHVPGFGWAKDAAKKLAAMAAKANDAARAIDNIQRNVSVNVSFHATAGRIKVGNQQINVGMRAGGGRVDRSGIYQVGDNPDGSWNPTTELFVPDKPGRIVNQKQLAAATQGASAAPTTAPAQYHVQFVVPGIGAIAEGVFDEGGKVVTGGRTTSGLT